MREVKGSRPLLMQDILEKVKDERLVSFLRELDERGSVSVGRFEVRRLAAALYQGSVPSKHEEISLHPDVRRILSRKGLLPLFSHQSKAIGAIRKGKNVIVSTPAASGKSLVYLIPIFESFLGNPKTHALYLAPTKALERDQLQKIIELSKSIEGFRVAAYDGDTPIEERVEIRKNPPTLLLTNPDMLHYGILPNHRRWSSVFSNLKFIVLDEVHEYKGIFGAHVANVLRRTKRLAEIYGSKPIFIAASATIANPKEHVERLVGEEFEVIKESGSPKTSKIIVFWNPVPIFDPYIDAERIFIGAISAGLKTIVFCKSRKIVEIMTRNVKRHLLRLGREDLIERIASYRSGYLPKERRRIERMLFSGELIGVVATSALELGIDVGELDCCILVGYPGSRISTLQRAGRVGRRVGKAGIIVTVALEDALDQYFVRNPEELFSGEVEKAFVNPENERLLPMHVLCASSELPIREGDSLYFGNKLPSILNKLEREGKVRKTPFGYVSLVNRPHVKVRIRSIEDPFTLINVDTGREIGHVDGARVFRECYPGAIYLHMDRAYLVVGLDIEGKNVLLRKTSLRYYTQELVTSDVTITSVLKEFTMEDIRIRHGEVRVTERVIGFRKKPIKGGPSKEIVPLSLPPYEFESEAIWFEFPMEILRYVEDKGSDFAGGIHGSEHALIAMAPLFTLSDRGDLGGVSTPLHPQVGGPGIFIYEAYPGGVGIVEKLYKDVFPWVEKTYINIKDCTCESGCLSCGLLSPKCGNENQPLDKEAAKSILLYILGKEVEGWK
ncbi:MAG TPA: DEAD/DEAH box helicase [Candidatus Korarchaeota archaeon]|nr:DEAD/DEAH box helicase [Candidatus Korarchaeota archaeon]